MSTAASRRGLLALVAVPFVVIAVIAVGLMIFGGDDEAPVAGKDPSATPSASEKPQKKASPSPSPAPSTSSTPPARKKPKPAPTKPVRLSVVQPPAARCGTVTVQFLKNMQTAFSGTATSVEGNVIMLRVDRWYRTPPGVSGKPTTVRLQASPGALRSLVQVLQFVEGERYLVTASGNAVTACGFSAAYDQGLADKYEAAFGA